MTGLLDVNILLALLWENHEQHPKVRAWFKGVSAFATCPVSQLGFACVSSHPMLGYGMTPDNAFATPVHDSNSARLRCDVFPRLVLRLLLRAPRQKRTKLKSPVAKERKFENVVKSAE